MQRGSLRTSCGEPLCVLTLLFGKVFFRIHFALGLEGLPVPIERKWIGNTYLDDSGRDSPASLNSTGDM